MDLTLLSAGFIGFSSGVGFCMVLKLLNYLCC